MVSSGGVAVAATTPARSAARPARALSVVSRTNTRRSPSTGARAALRRLARLAGVQPAAGIEEEELAALTCAGGVLRHCARVGERRHVAASTAVHGELSEEIEPVAGADAGRRAVAELLGDHAR